MFVLLIIVALCLLNGFFAMAEIAILSAKKARLQELQNHPEKGEGARAALALAAKTEYFLSTVQVGITFVGTIASVFGGEQLKDQISPYLQDIPVVKEAANNWAFALAVILLTYLQLIIGELAPKTLALRHTVAIACNTSRVMRWLSKLSFPIVWFLEKSTQVLLLPFGRGGEEKSNLRDEVNVLVREGLVRGTVDKESGDLLHEAARFKEVVTEEVMVPKPQVAFLNVEDTHAEIWEKVKGSKLKVFPVYKENRDDLVGMVTFEDLYGAAVTKPGAPIVWEDILYDYTAVPENQPLSTLYKTLQKHPLGAAMVVDEFGTVRGMVSIADLTEEVFGETAAEPDEEENSSANTTPDVNRPVKGIRVERGDADSPIVLLVDGVAEIDHVIERMPELAQEVSKQSEPFQTMAGFVMHFLDELPEEGQHFRSGKFEFEIMDMDTHRIDKVRVRRLTEEELAAAT